VRYKNKGKTSTCETIDNVESRGGSLYINIRSLIVVTTQETHYLPKGPKLSRVREKSKELGFTWRGGQGKIASLSSSGPYETAGEGRAVNRGAREGRRRVIPAIFRGREQTPMKERRLWRSQNSNQTSTPEGPSGRVSWGADF